MLPATPTLPITKSTSASIQSPRSIQNIATDASAPIARNTASSFFFIAAKSAIAPSRGATMATMRIAMVVAQANRLVAVEPGRSCATTRL